MIKKAREEEKFRWRFAGFYPFLLLMLALPMMIVPMVLAGLIYGDPSPAEGYGFFTGGIIWFALLIAEPRTMRWLIGEENCQQGMGLPPP